MIPKIGFFLLATTIFLCTGRGHAIVPRPHDQSLGMMADKYGNMETTDFGNLQLFIVI